MSRPKFWIFVALIAVLAAILLFRLIGISDNAFGNIGRNVDTNTAQEALFKSPGEYKIGESGLVAGYYDIKHVSGASITVNEFALANEQEVKGCLFANMEKVVLAGSGSVSFSPAKFTPTNSDETGFSLDNTSGEFLVGSEVAPGDYEVTVNAQPSAPLALMVQTVSTDYSTVYDSAGFSEAGSDHIKLKEDTYLQVFVLSTIDDFSIVFKKEI
jgi:hypothetical protein